MHALLVLYLSIRAGLAQDGAAPALPTPRAPTALGVVYSGGSSWGSYQAGQAFEIEKVLRDEAYLCELIGKSPCPARDQIDLVVTGASAGMANSLITMLDTIQSPEPDALRSLYYRTWIPVGIQGDSPNSMYRRDGDWALSVAPQEAVLSGIQREFEPPAEVDVPFHSVRYGFQITRMIPMVDDLERKQAQTPAIQLSEAFAVEVREGPQSEREIFIPIGLRCRDQAEVWDEAGEPLWGRFDWSQAIAACQGGDPSAAAQSSCVQRLLLEASIYLNTGLRYDDAKPYRCSASAEADLVYLGRHLIEGQTPPNDETGGHKPYWPDDSHSIRRGDQAPLSIRDLGRMSKKSTLFPVAFRPLLQDCVDYTLGAFWPPRPCDPKGDFKNAFMVWDGGLYENNPIRLTWELSRRSGDMTIVYIDPDLVAPLWTDGSFTQREPDATRPWDISAQLMRTIGSTFRGQAVSDFYRDYVTLHSKQKNEIGVRVVVAPVRTPTFGRFLNDFLGFFDRSFRIWDFYAGRYDALVFLESQGIDLLEVPEEIGPTSSLFERQIYVLEHIRRRTWLDPEAVRWLAACADDPSCQGDIAPFLADFAAFQERLGGVRRGESFCKETFGRLEDPRTLLRNLKANRAKWDEDDLRFVEYKKCYLDSLVRHEAFPTLGKGARYLDVPGVKEALKVDFWGTEIWWGSAGEPADPEAFAEDMYKNQRALAVLAARQLGGVHWKYSSLEQGEDYDSYANLFRGMGDRDFQVRDVLQTLELEAGRAGREIERAIQNGGAHRQMQELFRLMVAGMMESGPYLDWERIFGLEREKEVEGLESQEPPDRLIPLKRYALSGIYASIDPPGADTLLATRWSLTLPYERRTWRSELPADRCGQACDSDGLLSSSVGALSLDVVKSGYRNTFFEMPPGYYEALAGVRPDRDAFVVRGLRLGVEPAIAKDELWNYGADVELLFEIPGAVYPEKLKRYRPLQIRFLDLEGALYSRWMLPWGAFGPTPQIDRYGSAADSADYLSMDAGLKARLLAIGGALTAEAGVGLHYDWYADQLYWPQMNIAIGTVFQPVSPRRSPVMFVSELPRGRLERVWAAPDGELGAQIRVFEAANAPRAYVFVDQAPIIDARHRTALTAAPGGPTPDDQSFNCLVQGVPSRAAACPPADVLREATQQRCADWEALGSEERRKILYQTGPVAQSACVGGEIWLRSDAGVLWVYRP